MEHEPALQAGVPFTPLQAIPHPLQLLTLLDVFVSQPLVNRPSQFANGELQVMLQALLMQLGTPLLLLQMLLHAPQFSGSLVLLTSQPSFASPLQFRKLGLQLMPHTLFVQVAVPFVPVHTVVQELQ